MLMEDAELRERLGRAARQSIVKRFSWRKAAEETLAVYQELLARPASEVAPVGAAG